MIARSLQGKILVFAVFAIGIATGVLSTNLYETRMSRAGNVSGDNRGGPRLSPQERAKRDQDNMAKYLGLDEKQQAQIHDILEETWTQFRTLRGQVDPQFKAIEDASRARIRAVLTPEQLKKYDEFRASHPRGDRGRGPRPQDRDRDKDQKEQKQ